jgi:hypothetical protein
MKKLLASVAVSGAIAFAGANAPAAATLGDRPPTALKGLLDVASDPPAEVFIDETDTGKVTPQHRLELEVGHHKLTLVSKKDSVVKRTIGFNVLAGQTTKLTIHLTS